MARDVKYGTVTMEKGNIPADEPVIVFRAQDVLALIMLREYAVLAGKSGCSIEFMAVLYKAIREFAAWNGTRKRPD